MSDLTPIYQIEAQYVTFNPYLPGLRRAYSFSLYYHSTENTYIYLIITSEFTGVTNSTPGT